MNEQTRQLLIGFRILKIDIKRLQELLLEHDTYYWMSDDSSVNSRGEMHDKKIEWECFQIGVDFISVMQSMYDKPDCCKYY